MCFAHFVSHIRFISFYQTLFWRQQPAMLSPIPTKQKQRTAHWHYCTSHAASSKQWLKTHFSVNAVNPSAAETADTTETYQVLNGTDNLSCQVYHLSPWTRGTAVHNFLQQQSSLYFGNLPEVWTRHSVLRASSFPWIKIIITAIPTSKHTKTLCYYIYEII